jgi:hypothetical protein
MSKRKRFNPLEEKELPSGDPGVFPPTPGIVPAQGGIGETQDRVFQGQVERIERLRPSQMMPDRFQPRRLLPGDIRTRFFRREIDCYQAAREWLTLIKKDEGWKKRLDELLDMGNSFSEQGQIKPITGSWIPSAEGGFIFLIETGERRYWAACLTAVKGRTTEEPELRVEVIASPTRQRQVIENRHAQTPSAVGQACEVASLMLEELGVEPDPNNEDEFDYFRIALNKRAPRGMWPKIEPVMQYSTRRMQQLLALLQLPSPLLELADLHRIPERVLREVIQLPEKKWASAVKSAVKEELTSDEIADLRKGEPPRKSRDDARRAPERIAFTGIRRFTRAVLNVNEEERVWVLDGVADEVVVQGFGEALLPFLQGMVERIEARLKALE